MSNRQSDKPFAFVLMPFSATHDDTYNLGIKATVEAAGMIAQRVDEQIFHREGILQRIYNQIDAADFVIADMTGRNSNVFYEVGYSHAKDKLCILLTRDANDIPFDLKHHRHIVYSSIGDLRTKLASDLEVLRTELLARGIPINVELKSASGMLEKTKWTAWADTTIVLDMNNRTEASSPDIHAIYVYTGNSWQFKQGNIDCPSASADFHGHKMLRHFVQTPVPQLPKNGWAQIKLNGKKLLGTSIKGEPLLDSYKLTGYIVVRVSTAKGDFDSMINIAMDVDELPF